MATMIPESISGLENVTRGEKRVFKLFKDLLPDDYIVWYELRVEKKHPDFIIIGPDLGLVVIEVKDWLIGSIVSANKNEYELKTDIRKTTNPQKQAKNYMWEIVNSIKKDPKLVKDYGKYKGKPIFNYGHGVIFTRIAKKSFESHGLEGTIDKDVIIFQDDLKTIEDLQDGELLKEKILKMIPFKFEDNTLDEEQINRIRGNIFKEVKLDSDDEAVFKVMNLKQEQYAKGLGYGHRVIRGVAGSGKTVVLTCRAKYLAEVHQDWKILTVCYNTVLGTHLRDTIDINDSPNLETKHFHEWINGIFKELNMPTGVFKDEGITENILNISDEDLEKLEKYDAILIDEGQDLDRVWLEFIVKMLRNPEYSHLVLASDGAQNLYNRKYTLKSVGIKATGRTVIMRENYRNTKEILEFAHKFITDDRIDKSSDEEDNDFFIDPKSSLRNGPSPTLIECDSFNHEIETIVFQIKELKSKGVEYRDICILYFHGKQLGLIEKYMIENRIPYYPISKNSEKKKKFNYNYNLVKISTIHSAKGLDFRYIFICGFYKGLSKRYNESKKLIYVGMTRARDELRLTYSIDSDITRHLREIANGSYLKVQESKEEYKVIPKINQKTVSIEIKESEKKKIDNALSDLEKKAKKNGGFLKKLARLFS